LTLNPKP